MQDFAFIELAQHAKSTAVSAAKTFHSNPGPDTALLRACVGRCDNHPFGVVLPFSTTAPLYARPHNREVPPTPSRRVDPPSGAPSQPPDRVLLQAGGFAPPLQGVGWRGAGRCWSAPQTRARDVCSLASALVLQRQLSVRLSNTK
eukprot:496890-Pyramimonas_sp.AAC.1